MTYSFRTRPGLTSASQAIPGREGEMIKSASGAVTFKADNWIQLRRGLITGTAAGSFYASANSLTYDWEEILKACLEVDPKRVGEEIIYASSGHAINNSTAIYALVICSIHPNGKDIFKEIFNKVVRTGSHLHEFMSYCKATRGMGSVIHKALEGWFNSKSVSELSYQMLKYSQRYGFSFKDELRLLKPVTPSGPRSDLYGYVVGKKKVALTKAPSEDPMYFQADPELEKVYWYEWLKANPTRAVEAIQKGGLTHEMVAPIATMSKDVWQELFESMPVTATLRNLANLTSQGVLDMRNKANMDRLESIFLDRAVLEKAMIHPLDVLKALKTYMDGGRTGMSTKTWTPVPRIGDILEQALELSFEVVPRTDKIYLHGLDVSGSMGGTITLSKGSGMSSRYVSIPIRYCEVAAIMALVTAKSEPNYYIKGFASTLIDLGITARDSFSTAVAKVIKSNFGGTNAGKVYEWALQNKVYVDTFVFWTDSESWAGYHPAQLFKNYQKEINPEAKAIYVTLVPGRGSLVDPRNKNSFDLSGFDPAIPKMVSMISSGELG